MSVKNPLPVSCWIITESLAGLQNQAVGLGQALGVPYELKKIGRPKNILQMVLPRHEFAPPWPDLLITCGRRSVAISMDIRRASKYKTFTVHIQDPLVSPKHFDVVIAPRHDRLQGENVFSTMGAIHHISPERLEAAASHFRLLWSSMPRPLIAVLVGGKSRHQDFSPQLSHDFASKLRKAAAGAGGSLLVTFSRRTGLNHQAAIRSGLEGVPSYIWDGHGENPYLGFLALADAIIVTNDSISMISEACSTGKPVYLYGLPRAGRRHQLFCDHVTQAGMVRPFEGEVQSWKYPPLNETQRAADFVEQSFWARQPALNMAH